MGYTGEYIQVLTTVYVAEGSNMKYIIVFPKSHKHLGLFKDLEDLPEVELITAEQKHVNNPVLSAIKKVHLSSAINKRIRLPFRNVWYQHIRFNISDESEYCIIVIDGALQAMDPSELNDLTHKSKLRKVLVLINAMDASSTSMVEVKEKMNKIDWDQIYSFDPSDVKKYGFKPLGCCYYSTHTKEEIFSKYPDINQSDVYFTGGIKGDREELILSVFEKLDSARVVTDFHLLVTGERRLGKKLHGDKIDYFSGGWIPYEKLLAGILNTKIVMEVLQNGQSGPSLRYYEAVCYNKKLLSNNPNIVDFPYYDSRYMHYFSSADDIDIDWILDQADIDYGYKGDFSPVYMLEHVLKD